MVFSAIMAGLAIGGGILQARSQIKAGNAAKQAGIHEREASESQAELSDYNAAIADLQATDAIARGVEEENRFRTSVRGMIGTQRAGIAAGNVDVGFGSAVDVQADAAFLGELDALTIRTNAAREAWGYNVQAEDLRKRAAITRKEGVYLEKAGREQQSASRWAAGGTLLGTGASLLQQRYGYGGSGGGSGPLPSRNIGMGSF
jgi:hypothetical protein